MPRIEFLKSLLIVNNLHYQHPQQHPKIKTAITLYEAGKLDKTLYAMVHIKRVNFLEEALKAGLPIWMEVSAMSSLGLKCVLTDGLGRHSPSVYAKGLIPLMTRN